MADIIDSDSLDLNRKDLEVNFQDFLSEEKTPFSLSPRKSSSSFAVSANSNLFSETAMKRRIEKDINLQLEILQRQNENLENKNIEINKIRSKLLQELESKNRELKFFDKQVKDLQSENQNLKSQLDSTIKVNQQQLASRYGVNKINKNSKSALEVKQQEQIAELQNQIKNISREIKKNLNDKEELAIQNKVLQDALNFRSEEIGLAGHADLLTKVAKLKGEITALKQELLSKSSELSTVQITSKSIENDNEKLQNEINLIQERLAKHQQDYYRYENNDLVKLLKTTEQERDLLIEYIQQDMNKTVTLSRQVETFEKEIRSMKNNENDLQSQIKEQSDLIESFKRQILDLENENSLIKSQYLKESNQKQSLQQEYEILSKQLERKSLDQDDNNKIQATLYAQLKAKDEELLKKSEEIVVIKSKLQEFEISNPFLSQENQNMRNRLLIIDEDLSKCKRQLSDYEPKVLMLEPMVSKLQQELEHLREEKLNLQLENQDYKQIKQTLRELEKDLQEYEKIYSKSQDSNKSKSPAFSLSQQHSLWVGLPSLRNFHPSLYEKIRQLVQDLNQTERSLQDTQQDYHLLHGQYDQITKELNDKLEYYQQLHEQSSSKITLLTNKLSTLESELLQNRDSKALLHQIKVILYAHPQIQSTSISSELNVNVDEKISDVMLPDIVNQALLSNAQSVLQAKESTEKYQKLLQEYEKTKLQYQQSNISNIELENLYQETKEKLIQKDKRIYQQEQEFQDQLNEATIVIEKQNALMLALEGKVESLNRDKQLRLAQINSIQQKDDVLKNRVTGYFEKEKLPLPPNMLNNQLLLSDWVGFLCDHYCPRRTYEHVLDSNTSIFISNPSSNFNQTSATTRERNPSPLLTRNPTNITPNRSMSMSSMFTRQSKEEGIQPTERHRSMYAPPPPPSSSSSLGLGIQQNEQKKSGSNDYTSENREERIPSRSSWIGLPGMSSQIQSQAPGLSSSALNTSSNEHINSFSSNPFQERLKKAQQNFQFIKELQS